MSLAAVVGELWRCTTKNPPGLSQRSKVLERALGSLDQQQTRLSLGTSAAARPTRPPHGHLAPGSSRPSSPPVTGAGWVGSTCPHPRTLTHTRPRLRPHRAPNMATRGRRYIAFCHPMWAHGPGPAGHGSCLGVTCVDRPLCSPWRTCLAARATAHSVATERPAASTCPLPADFTFFLVTPLLEAAILYGLIGESCSGTHGPKPWTGGRGPGAGGWGRRGLAGAGNLGEAAPAARWGPQVFQEASG